jgi:hypothetical protein
MRKPHNRVVFSGSRDWPNARYILQELKQLDPKVITVLHGACPPKIIKGPDGTDVYLGADYMVDQIARKLGFTVEKHPANWTELGRKAGPIRNRQMIETGVDMLIAFQKDHSTGTQTAIDYAYERNKLIRLYTYIGNGKASFKVIEPWLDKVKYGKV